ncbi:MAG TPA: arginine deiminase-related protein [Candidatus Dormibacteraeota bacterium]|nr:arginine deiminase-related protein [Candidatus Dormibacteraeota bacterium]
MRILMCRPEYFGIEYEINPWMHVEVTVDHELAVRQWDALYQTYLDRDVQVELAEPVKGLPDMVFSANAAVLWQRRAVLSNFHFHERQGEEQHWRARLEQLGFEVCELPHEVSFEGAGDALFLGERLFCGHGFRTDRESHALVGQMLGVETVTLQLVDPRFYHLDTCFCPLDAQTAIFAPDAFDEESARTIRELVPRPIEVPLDVAAGFACNAMPNGNAVISSIAALRLEPELRQAGFTTLGLEMSEFMKSGGGVRCLSLPLDVGIG